MSVFEIAYHHTGTGLLHTKVTVNAPEEETAVKNGDVKFANINNAEPDPAYYRRAVTLVSEDIPESDEETAEGVEEESDGGIQE